MRVHEIAPEDIFIDSSNLPDHEASQFEGRVVHGVERRVINTVGIFFMLVLVGFIARAYALQIHDGAVYADISRNNALTEHLVFANRGIIYDRTGRELAWNVSQVSTTSTSTSYALRQYADMSGLSHILGYLQYPKKDQRGTWWRKEYSGIAGVERSFDAKLQGKNGATITEANVHGSIVRSNIVARAQNGDDLWLSIDASVQSQLYRVLSTHALHNNFTGGAAVIMDVRTGEIIALTSFPEYDNQAFTDGDRSIVSAQSNDSRTPLIDRAVSGLYTPGSIVKPIFAIAALNEKIISPDKQIHSIGAITLPNPYDPSKPSVFRDWRVHGWVDMRTALAVSSDEYFYTIGGGYGGQEGLGIARLDKYATLFGLSANTGIALVGEERGNIPTPAWKARVFGEDDPWRIGNTYHTAIGQYGFLVTPIQAVRFTAAIANGGQLLVPQIIASTTVEKTSIGISDEYLAVAREGMRMAVTSMRDDATVKSLNMDTIQIAAKTGTAQLGSRNEWMNSWSIGFWPAENPHYAYAVVLEQAPANTMSGASPAMRPFFEWLVANKAEYVK